MSDSAEVFRAWDGLLPAGFLYSMHVGESDTEHIILNMLEISNTYRGYFIFILSCASVVLMEVNLILWLF